MPGDCKSSSDRTQLDLRCYPNAGSSNERSRGSVVTVAWLATSNATQRPLLHPPRHDSHHAQATCCKYLAMNPNFPDGLSGEQSIGTHIIQDGAARAGSRDYGSRTKFIAHFNSYSEPSTELLVLFAQTLHSFSAAFLKDNMLFWHVCRPRCASGELRCSFVSGNSRKSARFVFLRVEAPHYP